MEHVKKMVLLPADSMEKLRQPSVSTDPLESLHRELTQILSARNLSDSEKWVKYQQVLHRCLRYVEQRRKPVSFAIEEQFTPTQANVEEGVESGEEGEGGAGGNGGELERQVHRQHQLQRQLMDQIRLLKPEEAPVRSSNFGDILKTVPKTFQNKASILLERLNKSDLIKWDDKGMVNIENQPISGSNIADLVNDVLRKRKTLEAPVGYEPFSKILATLNVPQELVGNSDRWNLIRRFATEVTSPASPHFETLWPKSSVSTRSQVKIPPKIDWESFSFDPK